jgi:hypothetical protein
MAVPRHIQARIARVAALIDMLERMCTELDLTELGFVDMRSRLHELDVKLEAAIRSVQEELVERAKGRRKKERERKQKQETHYEAIARRDARFGRSSANVH